MRTPFVLLCLSLALWAATFLPNSLLHPDLAPLALLSAGAAVFLMLRGWLRPTWKRIVVDGSNVLYWAGQTPDLMSLSTVLAELRGYDLDAMVWFDANAGHLIAGRYLTAGQLAGQLGLPKGCVHIAHRGTPADPHILAMANKDNLQIVSNDRYRDWFDHYPRLAKPGLLVTGTVMDGQARLRFPTVTAAAASPRRADRAARRWSALWPAARLPRPPRSPIAGPADRPRSQVRRPPAA